MAAPRVMLVDDEEDIIWGLSRALVKAGYDVMAAAGTDEALAKLSTQPVDILITDIKMPGRSGLELIMEARQLYPTIKAVVMTARGSEELHRETMERGAVEYIEKPFDLDMFLDMVARAKEEGFRGVVRDLKLVDVLQILSLERATAAVELSSPEGQGYIYFDAGEVVHAEFGKLQGEKAFYKILELEGGSFSLKRGVSTEKRTISKSLDNLMLTIYADRDEASRETAEGGGIGEFDVESFSFSEAVGLKETIEVPEEVKQGLASAATSLMTEGVEAVAIWDADGQVIFSNGKLSVEAAKSLSSAVRSGNSAMNSLGKGTVSEMLFTTPSGNIVMRQLSGGKFTVAVSADSKANPGLVRVSLIKSAISLEKLLAGMGK